MNFMIFPGLKIKKKSRFSMTVGTLKEVLNLEVAHMGSVAGDFYELYITYLRYLIFLAYV